MIFVSFLRKLISSQGFMTCLFTAVGSGLFTCSAYAAGGHFSLNASDLSILWALPFIGMLLSLAFFPIIAPNIWHNHDGKIALGWAMLVIIPMLILYGVSITSYEVLHTYLLEYLPFIIIAGALFTISGGITCQLNWAGSPRNNALLLLFATLIASWIGTTGAAMLFVRPLLKINNWRNHKTHIIIFFIILVCNLGGCLTALGDPPLFLGFLLGVDFFWPLSHLFVPFVLIAGPVLILFFFVDHYFYRQEDLSKRPNNHLQPFAICGNINFLLLLGVMLSVIISGTWDPGIVIEIHHVPLKLQNILRDVTLVSLSFISIFATSFEVRTKNFFTWSPILEVAKIFAAIFITATPVLKILSAGKQGALAPLVGLVTQNGEPINFMYFWLTGILSAFLDNAPTYLVFFYMAGGDAQQLMGPMQQTLTAISAGAVFMGALTYIGNAPNFMVKSIAEINEISMPSFFGYAMWSSIILLPLFFLMSLLMF